MAARKLAGSPKTFLVVGGHESCWRKPCGELFSARVGKAAVADTVGLFKCSRAQYRADLKYRGRVQSVPAEVRSESVATGLRPRHYPHLEFRIAAVMPEDPMPIPCTDGWPEGVTADG